MSITREPKQRKPKVTKAQTYAARRQADRRRRERQRNRTAQRQRQQQHFKFRVKVVRTYRAYRQQLSERQAAERTLAQFQPRAEGDFPLSIRTIREWHRIATRDGIAALRPRSTRPHTIHYHVPELLVGVILTLRRLYGWGGGRMAAELAARDLGQVNPNTVYAIFRRHHVPIQLYALKGRSDGIAYRRYEKRRPNRQWHIDLKHVTLADGAKAYICVILDDYSRYALAAVAGTSATTDWVTQVAHDAIQRCGTPQELVSDNGREFVAVWEATLTKFGQLLAEQGIVHRTCAPYYPQGNGKVEAFNKTLTRELLTRRTFATLDELQDALDRYLTYYNNYRRHSALGWQPPVTRYSSRAVLCRGLAGLPGLEPMAANPAWGESECDPPLVVTPTTAQHAYALTIWIPSLSTLAA
jgi:transposase InsO family protein